MAKLNAISIQVMLLLLMGGVTRAEDGPERLAATPLSDTQIRLQWNGGSGSLVIERATDQRHYAVVATPASGATGFTDSGLTPGQLYTYRVRSGAAAGWQRWTYAAPRHRADAAFQVRGVQASWTDTGRIKITWRDETSNESGFALERSTDGTNFSPLASVQAGVTTYEDAAVTVGTTYHYRVRTLGSGIWSGKAPAYVYRSGGLFEMGPTSCTHALPKPASVAASSVATSENRVTWSDTLSNETGFAVLYATDNVHFYLAGTTPANVTTFRHTGALDGVLYYYRVVAIGAGPVYSLPSASASRRVLACSDTLPAPSHLVKMPSADGGVDLYWMDHATGESGFAIERQASRIGTVGANVTFFHDPDGHSYADYRVQALGTTGASRYSAQAVDLSAPFSGPAALSASALSPTKIRLAWTAGGGGSAQFVERSLDGIRFERVAVTRKTVFEDTLRLPQTLYRYRIVSQTGVTSNVASATTPALSSVPPVPGGFWVGGASRSQLNLRWDLPGTETTSVVVERSSNGGASFSAIATLNGRASGFSDTGRASGTYAYRIRARNGAGHSPYSAVKSASTPGSDPSVSISSGLFDGVRRLTIQGTEANDAITVSQSGANLVVRVNGGAAQSFAGPFGELKIFGKGGADSLVADAGVSVRALLYGGHGDDTLRALGSGKNTIVAVGGGRDTCQGNGTDTSYWADTADVDTVQSGAQEIARGGLHRVTSFQGALDENRPLELNGQSWNDPSFYSSTWSPSRYPTKSFWGAGPVMFDVNQGNTQDCPCTGPWQTLAEMVPEVLEELAVDLGDGTFAFRYADAAAHLYSRVDGDVKPGVMSNFGPSGNLWWLILEKYCYGYLLPWPLLNHGSYLSLHQSAEQVYAQVNAALQRRACMTAGTTGLVYLDAPVVRQSHVYGLVGAFRALDGSPRFILRDPYGTTRNTWNYDLPEVQGLITLTFDELRANFLDPFVCETAVHFGQGNTPPSAFGQVVETNAQTPKAVKLDARDPDGDALSYAIVTPPAHGTLSGTAPNLTYTPHATYSGADRFTFKAADGQTQSLPATVTIAVLSAGGAPTIESQPTASPNPIQLP